MPVAVLVDAVTDDFTCSRIDCGTSRAVVIAVIGTHHAIPVAIDEVSNRARIAVIRHVIAVAIDLIIPRKAEVTREGAAREGPWVPRTPEDSSRARPRMLGENQRRSG